MLTVDYLATEDTVSNCLSINATESNTASDCNCFTSVDLYDAPGMRSDTICSVVSIDHI